MEENNITTEQVAETVGELVVTSKPKDTFKNIGKISGVAVAVVVAGFALEKAIKFVMSKMDQKNAKGESTDEPTVTVDSPENDTEE